ncbi:hypothetical protein [Vibrio sp. 10N.261.46.A3]|uniref:hypothetical protein n=1 Tax=Vibrio sp. 10N.261.46.A3 TaxID=3229658 RepID=UPI0035538E26
MKNMSQTITTLEACYAQFQLEMNMFYTILGQHARIQDYFAWNVDVALNMVNHAKSLAESWPERFPEFEEQFEEECYLAQGWCLDVLDEAAPMIERSYPQFQSPPSIMERIHVFLSSKRQRWVM